MDNKTQRQLTIWLFSGCILIFIMVIIGGITRLTKSGLSMVEWHPISGIIPPLTDGEWQIEFMKYKQFPEYKKLNNVITLAQFKFIFFWEYVHRLVGRLLSILFILPFAWFFIKKKLNPNLMKKLLIIFYLGGLQGVYGWYMVKSGLVDDPHVSHYRLAGHLVMAFGLMAYILWVTLEINRKKFKEGSKYDKEHLKPVLHLILLVLILQIIYGAFTAGLNAGMGWNTFPKIAGHWIPGNLFPFSPWYLNLVEHNLMVQYIHRMLGWGLCMLIPGFWRYTRGFDLTRQQDVAITAFMNIVVVQFLLGVLTLIWVIPIWIAILHQVGALLLLATWVYCYFLILNAKDN